MPDEKHLYGAAVQGIQSFIFQTNELKDIVGASELVEQICTIKFAELLGKDYQSLENDPNAILMAAGNIKYIFTNREACENFVRTFPKVIAEMAPGITISQAVVKLSDNFKTDVEQLEALLRIQRNKTPRSATLGLMGIRRSRKTGLPAIKYAEGEYLDMATTKKREYNTDIATRLCQKSFGFKPSRNQITTDINKFIDKNDWIAIIHVDGNGLGQVVQKVGKGKQDFKTFSKELNECTILSANTAFKAVEKQFDDKQVIPIRPIILGGDDLTLICRADLAIPYVKAFLESFEENTRKKLGSMLTSYHVFDGGADRLTACAGISYVKSSFPFHYGYRLAEALCTEAKKDAKKEERKVKGLAPSCLMFHKVQDSFIEDFTTIIKRELTPNEKCSFLFGPYYLDKQSQRWNIDELEEKMTILKGPEGNAVKSHLRQWMSILHDKPERALQKRARILNLLEDRNSTEGKALHATVKTVTDENNKREGITTFPVYDLLSLYSIMNQETNTHGK